MSFPTPTASIATWNLEWAKPGSASLGVMLSRLADHDPDVVCFTEGYLQGMPTSGHAISGCNDWGYTSDHDRRKVILWSRSPWHDVDEIGDLRLPGGRFVAGSTNTPFGALRVIGVCIPWRDAHVRTGRGDRDAWEEHLAYLETLQKVLQGHTSRTIILGDFNQRIPRRWTPEHVHQRLLDAFEPDFSIVTEGLLEPAGAQAIDHMALSNDLIADQVTTISNLTDGGRHLSDHFGITAKITTVP